MLPYSYEHTDENRANELERDQALFKKSALEACLRA